MTTKAQLNEMIDRAEKVGPDYIPPEFSNLMGYRDRSPDYVRAAWQLAVKGRMPPSDREVKNYLLAVEGIDEDNSAAKDVVRWMIAYAGDDPERPGLEKTPERVLNSWKEIFSGYHADIYNLFTVFEEPCDELIVLREVEFYSTCEHHMLPFIGVAHIGYIPQGKVIGVSKLARLLDAFARRLQIQERIGQQVTSMMDKYLNPRGSACVLEAKHLCMTCRGVNKQHSTMVTSSLTGVFREDSRARAEFFSMIKR